MDIKIINLTSKLLLFLISFVVQAQQDKTIVFLDEKTKEVVSFVHVSSECNSNIGSFSNDLGICILDFKEIDCIKWRINHISYKSLVFDISFLNSIDTILIEPLGYTFEDIEIVSNKTDNQYLYDKINLLLKAKRKQKETISSNYFYVLRSWSDQALREEINATLKLKYAHSSGFESSKRSLVSGNFWYHPEAIFLNLNTERIIYRFSPFAKELNEFKLPLNAYKLTKKTHKIQRIVCDDCSESQYYVQIISIQNGIKTILKYDYLTFLIEEYRVEFEESNALELRRLNNEKSNISNLKLKYNFQDNIVDNIQFQFYLKFNDTSDSVKVLGFLKNEYQDIMSKHDILGEYSADNLYEEISLSMPDSISLDYGPLAKATANFFGDVENNHLSSSNSSVREAFLSLPNSRNTFITHGQKRLVAFDYQSYILPKEYWYFRYEKKVFNHTKLNFNWVFKVHDIDSNSFSILSLPTLWNVNYSNLYATYRDTIHFNFCSNLLFDWVECKRQKLIDSLGVIKFSKNQENHIKTFIDTTFRKVNSIVQQNMLSFMDEKMTFKQVEEINREIYTKLKIDNLAIYFASEIRKIILDSKYESTINRYMALGNSVEAKDKNLFLHCMKSALILRQKLIVEYEKSSDVDRTVLGSFYGLQAETYIKLDKEKEACDCLRKYIKYWPVAINYSSLKKDFYDLKCKE
ncbi:MAG: hypothetical protein IPM42_16460 [Saprospiraceae bacterium]|nr:hypothetical protein [Saprospiraceae bacterium]